MVDTKKTAIERRQDRQKELLLAQLRKTPIVQVACEKAGVSRATYYRWLNDDAAFAASAQEACAEGAALVSDMAESQVLNLIRSGNLGAITFWLRHRHAAYRNKLDISALVKHEDPLTDEEAELVHRALDLIKETNPDEHGNKRKNPEGRRPEKDSRKQAD